MMIDHDSRSASDLKYIRVCGMRVHMNAYMLLERLALRAQGLPLPRRAMLLRRMQMLSPLQRASVFLLLPLLLCVLLLAPSVTGVHDSAPIGSLSAPYPPHSSNWAVIVSSSRSWLNYRHMANALSVYHALKRMGMPDSHIILMLPEEIACHPRNGAFAGQVFGDASHEANMYSSGSSGSSPSSEHATGDVEVDFRGRQVCVSSFLRLLYGRQSASTPRSQRLGSDQHSNVLLYLSGHGGDEFLKFHDSEELSAVDLGHALLSMHRTGRFANLLLLVDTCEAATLFNHIRVPHVHAIASSGFDEKSYSRDTDDVLGVSLSDRFTHRFMEFFRGTRSFRTSPPSGAASAPASLESVSLADFFDTLDPNSLLSNAEYRYSFDGEQPSPNRSHDGLDAIENHGDDRSSRIANPDEASLLSHLSHAVDSILRVVLHAFHGDDEDSSAPSTFSLLKRRVAGSRRQRPTSSIAHSSSALSTSLSTTVQPTPEILPMSHFVSPLLAVRPIVTEYPIQAALSTPTDNTTSAGTRAGVIAPAPPVQQSSASWSARKPSSSDDVGDHDQDVFVRLQ